MIVFLQLTGCSASYDFCSSVLNLLVQYKLLFTCHELCIMCMYVYSTYCSHITLVALSVLILVFYLKHYSLETYLKFFLKLF